MTPLDIIRTHLPYIHPPSVALGIVICLLTIAITVTALSSNRH